GVAIRGGRLPYRLLRVRRSRVRAVRVDPFVVAQIEEVQLLLFRDEDVRMQCEVLRYPGAARPRRTDDQEARQLRRVHRFSAKPSSGSRDLGSAMHEFWRRAPYGE